MSNHTGSEKNTVGKNSADKAKGDEIEPDKTLSYTAIVLGSGAIGSAVAQLIVERDKNAQCVITYRKKPPSYLHPRIHPLLLDALDEQAFVELKESLKELGRLRWIINTIGILHDHEAAIKPEKRINDFSADSFQHVMGVNVLPTMYAAKHWLPLLDKALDNVFCTVSAKVGSIEDNRLGGWYSYRASKSCLNMMLKNLSIEFKQKNKRLCVLALHPGTTDSALSAPFQKNVPAEKLFSSARTASQLLDIIEDARPQATGNFYSWDRSQIPW